MNAAMLRRSEQDIRKTALWFSLGSAIFGVFIGLIFPTVRESAEDFDELLENYPEPLRRAFGIEEGFSITEYGNFVSAEYLSFVWPVIAGIFVIMAAASVVAREIESGTIALWLSVPEERWELLLAKLIILTGASLLFAALTMLAISLTGLAVDADIDAGGFAGATLIMFSYMVALGGIAAFLSSMFNERGRAAGLTAAFVLASYVISIIAELSDAWNWLRYLSIFTAYVPDDALTGDSFPLVEFVILCAIGVVTGVASLVIFQRRDITA